MKLAPFKESLNPVSLHMLKLRTSVMLSFCMSAYVNPLFSMSEALKRYECPARYYT